MNPSPNRSQERGFAVIGICVAIGIAMILGFQAFSMHLQYKTKHLFRQLQSARQSAIFEMIATRALAELKQQYLDSTDPTKTVPPLPVRSLDHLLRSTSRLYNQDFPRVFGKGQFQIDLLNAAGGPSTLFVAPETDVTVRIEPTIGGGHYRVIIQTTACRTVVAGRVRFPAESLALPNPGLGAAWNPACPPESIVNVTHSLFVNTAAPAFQS